MLKNRVTVSSGIIIVTTQVLMGFICYWQAGWYFEFGVIEGFIMVPIFSAVLSGVLVLILSNLLGNKSKVYVVTILSSSILAEMLFLLTFPIVSPFFTQLDIGRRNYENAESVRFYDKSEPQIAENIKKKIQPEWRLEEIRYDNRFKIYWFTVLEPSPAKGSIRYVGIYREENNKITQIVHMDYIWEQVVHLKGLSEKDKYEKAMFNFNDIAIGFRTYSNTEFYAYLTVIEDKIQIKKV